MIRKELGIFYPVKFTMILRSGISCGIWEWRREFATPRWDTTPRPRYSTPSPWGSSPGRGAEGPAPFKADTLTNVTHKFIIIHRYFNIHFSIHRYYTIQHRQILYNTEFLNFSGVERGGNPTRLYDLYSPFKKVKAFFKV